MARTGMADIITRLRGMVFDPAGASQLLTDDELQAMLDMHRMDYWQSSLYAQPTTLIGGSVAYYYYYAPIGDWEASPTLQDMNYYTLAPAGTALQRGVWTFGTSQQPPVYITGSAYDIYGAAVDALQILLSKERASIDFDADGASFKRSQRVKHIEGLIQQYAARAQAQTVTMVRGDVNPMAGYVDRR
jgi:hypothetical protein